ncbi:hypothetical protein V493_04648, partial [Pseudogymnoascus sp. VKM F-4281 (FW-2241)]
TAHKPHITSPSQPSPFPSRHVILEAWKLGNRTVRVPPRIKTITTTTNNNKVITARATRSVRLILLPPLPSPSRAKRGSPAVRGGIPSLLPLSLQYVPSVRLLTTVPTTRAPPPPPPPPLPLAATAATAVTANFLVYRIVSQFGGPLSVDQKLETKNWKLETGKAQATGSWDEDAGRGHTSQWQPMARSQSSVPGPVSTTDNSSGSGPGPVQHPSIPPIHPHSTQPNERHTQPPPPAPTPRCKPTLHTPHHHSKPSQPHTRQAR